MMSKVPAALIICVSILWKMFVASIIFVSFFCKKGKSYSSYSKDYHPWGRLCIINGMSQDNVPILQLHWSYSLINYFLLIRSCNIADSHSCPNINCQPHHYKPTTSCTNRNTATTATVPGANGAVPATRWPRPDTVSADYCPVTKRSSYSCSDSHTAGSSRARLTTGRVYNLCPSFFRD